MRLSGTKTNSISQYRGLGNQLYDAAGVVPSLDLDFASTKALTDNASGQQLVTFTRASSGIYVGSNGLIKTATTNEARFDHNPTTGESLGLLVEEQRTNNLLQSEDFSTTWGASLVTISTNTVTAPDGTLTADTFGPVVGDGLTSPRFLRQNPALTTQQAYTFSVFVKVGTATTNGISLYVSDSLATVNFRCNFNLFNQTVSPASATWATPTATIVPYPNGWYRCILSGVTSTVHTGLRANIYLNTFGNTSDTYGTHHIWGAQLEAGAFPTSYIPTTTATATRAADVASIAGANFSSFYNQTEGTVFADAPGIYSTGSVCTFSDGSNNNRILLDHGTNTRRTRFISGGSEQAAFAPSYTYGTQLKTSFSYASNYFSMANAGVLASGAPDTTGLLSVGIDRIFIGSNSTGASTYSNTSIRRLTYWPTRFADTTLQEITQP
jgi:hypothetical protein